MACCYKSDLACLINRKVIIHTGHCTYCVIICNICDCYLQAIDLRNNGNIRVFNLDRIDYIEDVLPY